MPTHLTRSMAVRLALLWLSLAATQVALSQTAHLPPGTSAPVDAPATQHAPAAGDALNVVEAKLDARDYPGAKALLLAYLSSHPTDARALFDLGYADDASGDQAGAEASYRKAVTADPQQFEATSALGLLLADSGRQQEAARLLAAAAKLSPNPPNPSAQAQSNRALARLLEPSDPAAASQALVAALRQSPETPEDTLLAADLAAKTGNTEAAADRYGNVLNQAAAGSPEQAEAAAGLAHLLIAARRYSDAEPVLRKALAADPGNPALNTQLAEVLVAENKPQDAVGILETLHAADPKNDAVTGMLADLYRQTGDAAKADPLYAGLLAAHPHDPALLAEEGDALVRAGKNAEAVPILEEATRADPANGNAWSSLAFAADQVHQPQLVLDALAMRSKVMSDNPATYFLAATACDSLHATKRAVALYRQFLSVAGNSFPDEVWQAKHRLIALAK